MIRGNDRQWRQQILSTVAAAALIVPADAFAQETTGGTEETSTGEDIVVTGTLVRNPNLEATGPVNVIDRDEIDLQQANVAEELLRELPGVVPSIGSAVNNGNGGASYVNLRGLGINRNIVLLNGHRIAPANFIGSVDLNNIPLALIERVDVLTGGASTTYGADAVGGVVNFITRRSFTGIELSLSEQVTERGDGNRIRADATAGTDFHDGRGNVVLSIGYQDANGVPYDARDVSKVNVAPYTGVFGGGSGTTVPSVFSFARGGVPATTPAPGLLSGNRQVDPAIGAVRTTGPGIYSRFNFNPYNTFQTPFERLNLYGQARYRASDAIELFTRGLYSRNTVTSVLAPAGVLSTVVAIPVSNPFLPAGLRAQFCANNDFQHGGAAGSGAYAGAVGNLNTPGIQPLSSEECAAAALATDPSDPAYRTFTTVMSRRTTETGPRLNDFRTTIFDVQMGLRGNFSSSINYELVGSYGKSKNLQTMTGFILTSRARQALMATNGSACLDASRGCVPADFFGPEGSLSSGVLDFLSESSTTSNSTTLAQLRGTMNVDTRIASPFAKKAIDIAVGAEYRRLGAKRRSDELAQTPGELGGNGAAEEDLDGSVVVREAFAEIVAPLAEDRIGIESLLLDAGIRYSSYSVQAEGDPGYDSWTYKIGGQWEPVKALKFRGQYSRAERAPNIGELFLPRITIGTPLSFDPCEGEGPTLNAELRAICLAQGAPAFMIGGIEGPLNETANATGGGNLALRPEKADTFTLGLVVRPPFVPGLTVSVDWFDIKVRGAVSNPTAGDAIFACFGDDPLNPAPGSSTSEACTSIRRDPNTGSLSGNPVDTAGLPLATTNLGVLTNRGVDLTANYERDLGFARLSLDFVGTYNKDSKLKASPTAIDRECVGFYSVNCGSLQPKFQFAQRTTLDFGPVALSLAWRFLDRMRFEPRQFEEDLEAALADPDFCEDPLGADPAGCIVDERFRRIRAYHYFDLSARFDVARKATVILSVENLLDRKPPLTGALIGPPEFNAGNTYPSTYDALGRKYAASIRVRF